MDQIYYALWHCYVDACGCDQDKLIGIYSTREKAEQGMAQLRDKSGFIDHPDGFEVLEGRMDETCMLQGFVTASGGEEPGK